MSGLRDKPAYPTLGDEFMDTPNHGRAPKSAYGMDGAKGMTYREAAALHIMAGFASDPDWTNRRTSQAANASALAVEWADALIAALEAQDATTPKEAPTP